MDLSSKVNRSALKSYFVKNAVPTASNFADLIDGAINQREDGLVKLPGDALSVQAEGDGTGQQKALNLYRNFADSAPAFTLALNPRADPLNAATSKPGFSVNDARGTSRLFIDLRTGNLGVGTIEPGNYRLNVNGSVLFSGDYLYVNAEAAGRLRVGAAWGMPGLFSGADGAKPLVLGVPLGQKVYLGTDKGDAFVEGGTGNAYFKGNVGIGTPTPAFKLDLKGALKVEVAFNAGKDPDSKLVYGGSLVLKGDAPQIDFIDTDHPDWAIHVNSGKMYFIREPWNSSDLVLDGKGNVGIGTDAPTHQFHVKAPDAVGLFESTGGTAYLRIAANDGLDNRVEITNRGGGRLSLWVAGAGDAFNVTRTGNVGVGTIAPTVKFEVAGSMMERMDVIATGNRGDWGAANHPIMQYFLARLRGKPVGTYLRAVQDHKDWRGHYWQGWVDADGRIRVIHNQINTGNVIS